MLVLRLITNFKTDQKCICGAKKLFFTNFTLMRGEDNLSNVLAYYINYINLAHLLSWQILNHNILTYPNLIQPTIIEFLT